MTRTQYPVLVYGTLRPGNGNFKFFLEGNTTLIENAVRVPGFQMLAGPRSGFPFVIPADVTDEIVADLVYIAPDRYDEVLQSLDFLEGYNPNDTFGNLYDRVLVDFEANGVRRQAYMYVAAAGTRGHITDIPVLANGDWNNRYEAFV